MESDDRFVSNTGIGSGSSMASLNPNGIELITVLKDAAAASVYGSRAAIIHHWHTTTTKVFFMVRLLCGP